MRENANKRKIVCIGGGTGLSTLVKGLKKVKSIDITAIVTVADDGGNSGTLREELNIPAVGDIRNVIVALSDMEYVFEDMMNHRFDQGSLQGHSLGNLILASLTRTTGDILSAIEATSKIFNIKGKIIPVSNQVITLSALMKDDTIIDGESKIPLNHSGIKHVYYKTDVKANKEAVEAILEADYIIYSMGSLYTSILPNLIIEDIKNALNFSSATKIYLCNAMSEPGETDGYTVSRHLKAIAYHLHKYDIDIVVASDTQFNNEILNRYRLKNSYPVELDVDKIRLTTQVIKADLIDQSSGLIRHDVEQITKTFQSIFSKEE